MVDGDTCGCGTPFHGGRRFWTKEEKIARLERYLESLEKEVQAVKEQMAEMTGEGQTPLRRGEEARVSSPPPSVINLLVVVAAATFLKP